MPPTNQTTPPPTDAPPAPAPGKKSKKRSLIEELLPESMRTIPGAELLAEACYVFGVDPNPGKKPRELLNHSFKPGDPDAVPPEPPAVVLVTGNGLKIRYPIDRDTEERLRGVYNAYRIDKATGERMVLPLPADLTLPRNAVTGVSQSDQHQYATGYLREGGKAEGDRREVLDELRRQGKLPPAS